MPPSKWNWSFRSGPEDIPISTSKRKRPPQAQAAAAVTLRLRGPLAWLGVSLVLAGFAVPFLWTVAGQLGEMVPNIGEHLWIDPYRAAAHRLLQDRQILAVRLACQRLAGDPGERPELEPFRQADPDNGLYAYLEVLAALREPGGDGVALLDRVRSLRTTPRVRLYLARQYRTAQGVFGEARVPPRRAARAAEQLRYQAPYLGAPELREAHGPLLRELANRLLDRGTLWRESGRVDDAITAHTAIVRLLTDLAEDSPSPDVVLLAADRLPGALRELARDAAAGESGQRIDETAGLAASTGAACREQADRIASLHERWHELADREGINVLPYTGGSFHVLLAPREHRNAMCSLCVTLLLMATWLVLLALCLVWLGAAFLTFRPIDIGLAWRSGRRSQWLAAAIVCGPAVLLSVLIWVVRIDFTWLISLPSVWAVCLWPALVPVMVGLAARLQMTPAHPAAPLLGSRAGVWIPALVLVLTGVLGPVLLVPQKDPWQPPGAIQSFRTVGFLVGFESVVVAGVWITAALARLRRGKFSLRLAFRMYLHVASVALLVVSLISLAGLVANHCLDRAHQRAFAEAAADPLGDRLGDAWYETYFGGARALAERLEPRHRS